ncbi:hypothetical protein, partial [Bacteroides ovatus]|uniref:hypothetical protein n=1 Tax=Bacteroides ovatus TaxID=28116 RepID=UPI001E28B534
MVFLLLSFQYQFKDKYFDAANLRLPHALHTTPPLLLYALIRPVSTVNCTTHYRKVISAGDFFSIRSNILITRVV